MKTVGKIGVSFGFSAVNAGQRNTTVDPQLIVVSTEGNFRITPPVSKALNVGHGENIMFLSNINEIDQAISAKVEAVVEFCEANGLEVGSPEAAIALHKEFDQWAIAKGIQEYDPKGNVRTGTERLSKKDRAKFVNENFDAMLEAALEQADEEVKEALSRDGVTKAEQIEILSPFVEAKEVPKYKGSKVANAGGLTGAGTSLTFTDSNVWKQMKADMGEDATKMNRVFDIDLDNVQDITLSNGYKEVTVKALILGDFTDKEPTRIGGGDDADDSAE